MGETWAPVLPPGETWLPVLPPGETWAHVLPPGEAYSPASGGSLGTVAAELSREHTRHGGATVIVADRGEEHTAREARLLAYHSPFFSVGTSAVSP
ncbi:hypothetical protein AB0K48_54215, partial [Nonomuraea sp. NPDC055795]